MSRSTCTVCCPIRGGGLGSLGLKLLKRTAGPEAEKTNRVQHRNMNESVTEMTIKLLFSSIYRPINLKLRLEMKYQVLNKSLEPVQTAEGGIICCFIFNIIFRFTTFMSVSLKTQQPVFTLNINRKS